MLRLEKIKRSDEITIRLRDKKSIWNKLFLQSLGIAVGIHLFSVLLFHVAPFQVDTNNRIFAPIQVDIDYEVQEESALAETESEQLRKRPVSEPRGSTLVLPTIVKNIDPYRVQPVTPALPHEEPFSFVEERSRLIPPLESANGGSSPELLFSGSLAEYPLISLLPEPREVRERERLLYQVRAEGKTGELFWYNLQEGNLQRAKEAEQILQTLRFTPNPKLFTISGEVEVILAR